MKQKLFGALALSVALAACTNEEELVISTNGGNAQLAGRPVIGQVDLTTTPATRAAVVDGTWGALTYQTGDAIGAALVDEPNMIREITGHVNSNGWKSAIWTYAEYATDTPKEMDDRDWLFTQTRTEANNSKPYNNPVSFYDLCGSTGINNIIHTNYGYSLDENGKWTTEANLVEGHYMFYFPFNANNSSRMPINVEIPAEQDCSDGNSIIDKFYAESTSPIAVDVKFLQKPAAGQKATVNATPNHLFAFPQFKIVNNFNGYKFDVKYSGTSVDEENSAKVTDKNTHTQTMTIKKVEFVYTGTANTLWTKATIHADSLNKAVKNNWEANKFVTASYTSAVTVNEAQPGYDQDSAKRPYFGKANVAADFGGSEQVITCEINKELANGQEYVFNAIMPAESYEASKMKARVYVTIGLKDYILMDATTKGYENDTQNNDWNKVNNVRATKVEDVFVFTKPFELVRGERYPIVEYNTDSDGKTSVKSSAGKTLTINLKDLHAFEVGTYRPAATTRGFETEAQFIDHMEKAIRGEALTEVTKNSNTGLKEHEIAFKNNITLDADLVETIYNNVEYGNMKCHMMLNFTNLGIAKDVVVSNTYSEETLEDRTYHVYTLTGNRKSIKVWYNTTIVADTEYKNIINNDAENLISGINEISSNKELKNKNGNSGVGIVFLSATDAKIGGNANTYRVVVNSGKLTVNGDCGAQINTKSGSELVVEKNLNNSANVFEYGTKITNSDMKTINGNVNGNTITANVTAWPTTVSNASKVNKVVINPSNAETAITVDQASFNAFQNANTVIELGANVSSIRSTADVNLTSVGNLKQIKGNGTTHKWTAATGNIIVTAYNAKDDDKPIQIYGITADPASVTFNMVDR